MNYKPIKEKTYQKFDSMNFEPGDMFSEMFSYWEIIVKVKGDIVFVIQKYSNNFELQKFTKEEYVKHCRYSSGIGYWIDFMKNDTSKIKDYLEALIRQGDMTLEEVREFKLDLVL